MDFYKLSSDDVLSRLKTSRLGLGEDEALRRQGEFGLNELETKSKVYPLFIFLSQFKSFIIYILLFAVTFSIIIGEYIDSTIILAILLANAFIGFFQELSASRSLEALKRLTSIKALVLRDGRKIILDSRYLVPGDIIFLESGDKVPADARIIEAVRLKTEEATLTGESLPVEKNSDLIGETVTLGSRRNMLFSSTSMATGNAVAVVTATGMDTEIGRITHLIKEAKEEMTPLQWRLDRFGRKLGYAIIAICFFIFIASFAREYMASGMVTWHAFVAFAFIAISLAVAAVPTALPAVVTISLSVGAKRLLAKKTLVRKLSSVETLGSCDVICTDKTGTLTENQMTVRRGWTPDGETTLSGSGYDPEGGLSDTIDERLFRIGSACNNATLNYDDALWKITGDPTEAALLVSARKAGIEPEFSLELSRLDELPFDSERKIMSVLVSDRGQLSVNVKGAPDEILKNCSYVLINGNIEKMDAAMREKIIARNDLYASQAMRVLAFAFKDVERKEQFDEEDLVFAGLQAMIDPPRKDVIESMEKTKLAGIRTVMITGDYKETARSIGKEIGIEGEALTGEELEAMGDEALVAALRDNTNIFARVVPEHKLRIVTALQRLGHNVAMTGDGVNDAPALKKANIGVAVGSGTDVAKEASDFVLLDDSFSNIVNAIEEGRGIYDNIQKSIMLLLSGNLGEVLIIFLAVISGLNLPLTAILLLWINMVTDGAPALAYSVDPYGRDIMKRKPKPRDEAILPLPHLLLIAVLGVAGTGIALFLFSRFGGASSAGLELMLGQTMVFNFVVLYEVILVFIVREGYKVPLFSNRWIWASVLLSVLFQAVLMYTPVHALFKIVPLGTGELLHLLAGGLSFYGFFLVYQHGVVPAIFGRKGY
ncbi:MAG: cation-translocating P-type ATPase [bacterium]|nr:cation-translocating P-type ATPase [bacterium]